MKRESKPTEPAMEVGQIVAVYAFHPNFRLGELVTVEAVQQKQDGTVRCWVRRNGRTGWIEARGLSADSLGVG